MEKVFEKFRKMVREDLERSKKQYPLKELLERLVMAGLLVEVESKGEMRWKLNYSELKKIVLRDIIDELEDKISELDASQEESAP